MNDNLRAGDRDRDEVTAFLREQYAEGRLTMAEFDERSTAACEARTMGELRALTVDLPATGSISAAQPQEAAWSSARMRWIAAGAVLAAAAFLVGAVLIGRMALSIPTWIILIVVIKLANGRRRTPRAGGPRAGRGC